MLTGDELMDLYAELSEKYPIVTIEDPFDQVCRPGPAMTIRLTTPMAP